MKLLGLLYLVGLLGIMLPALGQVDEAAPLTLEVKIAAHFQPLFSEHKQQIFLQFHPIGHGTGVTVDSVQITQWAGGQPTGRGADVQQFAINYTVYWTSPLHPGDGVTQVKTVYGVEDGVWKVEGNQVVKTNGKTRSNILSDLPLAAKILAMLHGL